MDLIDLYWIKLDLIKLNDFLIFMFFEFPVKMSLIL